jgi:hypothetical protein
MVDCPTINAWPNGSLTFAFGFTQAAKVNRLTARLLEKGI